MKKKNKYLIISYGSYLDNADKYIWKAKTKKEAVGLTKTIIDNFNPAHIDIMNERLFKKEFGKRRLKL